MTLRAVTLISPGPIDGYPPVQSQARLLAAAGHQVHVVSVPMAGRMTIAFSHPGVTLHTIPHARGRLRHWYSRFLFVAAIRRLRRRHAAAQQVEIAYDPDGMALSDLVPGARPRRIAHFHEMLVHLETRWTYRRLRGAMQHYDRIVVADAARAPVLRDQLALPTDPLVIPNYPLLLADRDHATRQAGTDGFEVIYGGSLGVQQRLDLVIRSVALWPAPARLTLLGDRDRPAARELQALTRQLGLDERVQFAGWLDTDALVPRYRQAQLGISLLDPAHEQWRLSIGASNKRYQYMQAGLPQIGDNIAGVPELLAGNGIGTVVADYTPEAIAAAVAGYVADPARARAEGARAEALHRSRYNYQAAFAPVLRWIEEHAR